MLLGVVVPEIHKHVQSFLPPNSDVPMDEAFQSTPGLRFWLKMMESIKDPYSLERMTEQLLKQLAAQNTGDIEAHWILWILFHQVFHQQASVRLCIFTMHYIIIEFGFLFNVLKRLLIWDRTSCFKIDVSFCSIFSFRSMFLEKFLVWKVFPSKCLRWILHFAVFQCSPEKSSSVKSCNLRTLSETLQRLVKTWSKRDFVQSIPIEQQACILFLFL